MIGDVVTSNIKTEAGRHTWHLGDLRSLLRRNSRRAIQV